MVFDACFTDCLTDLYDQMLHIGRKAVQMVENDLVLLVTADLVLFSLRTMHTNNSVMECQNSVDHRRTDNP